MKRNNEGQEFDRTLTLNIKYSQGKRQVGYVFSPELDGSERSSGSASFENLVPIFKKARGGGYHIIRGTGKTEKDRFSPFEEQLVLSM